MLPEQFAASVMHLELKKVTWPGRKQGGDGITGQVTRLHVPRRWLADQGYEKEDYSGVSNLTMDGAC